MEPVIDDVVEVLGRARQLGFLGPGPVEEHVEHALSYWEILSRDWPAAESALVADLGAGGGVPALPLLAAHPGLRMVLVDASQKRTSFLVWATVELGLADRAEVWCGRAERFAHDAGRRGHFDGVVARSFAPPASTLECGGPLLRPGGRLVLSEPPGYRTYPVDGVARCGLSLVLQEGGCAMFERTDQLVDGLPRPFKAQGRHPLFDA